MKLLPVNWTFGTLARAITWVGTLLIATVAHSGAIYWGDLNNRVIQRSPLDTATVQTVVTGAGYTTDIAIDSSSRLLYWTDAAGAAIRRSGLDGSNVVSIVSTNTPLALGLDLLGAKVYWTSLGSDSRDQIQRANLDGSGTETLVTGIGRADGFAIDPYSQRMFFTDNGDIRTAALDGSSVSTLIDSPNARGVDLDVLHGKIYWSDLSGFIRRADLDGSDIESVISTPAGSIYSLVVDSQAGFLYWADPSGGETSSINRSRLDGSNASPFVTGINGPRGLALWQSVPEPNSVWLVLFALVAGLLRRLRTPGQARDATDRK